MSNSAPPRAWRTLTRGSSRPGQATDTARGQAAPAPPSPLSLRKNFGWSFLANSTDSACRWLTVIVVAKLGDTEMIGVLLFALAITNLVSVIGNLGLRTTLVTDAKHEYPFSDYFGLRLATSFLALLAVGPVILLLDCERSTGMIIAIAAFGKFFESLSDIIHGLFQQHERMDWVAFSTVLREPIILALLAVGVYATGSLVWALLGFPLVAGTIWLCYDLPKARQVLHTSSALPSHTPPLPRGLRPDWSPSRMLTLARLATPAGIVAMLISLFLNLPRYVVEHALGARALGVFGAINSLAMSPGQFVMAMGNSAGPRLAKYAAARNIRAFARLVAFQAAILTGLGFFGVLSIALFGQVLLTVLYDAHIATHARLAVYLTAAAAILNCTSPFGRALDAMRCFWTHLAVRILSLATLMTLLPGFIRVSGLEGAAWAMITSATVTVAIYIVAALYGLCRLAQSPSSSTTSVPLPGKPDSSAA